MENGYVEPRTDGLFKESILAHHQKEDLSSPEMEQQFNPGFVQSPVHGRVQRPSELETSFSDELTISTSENTLPGLAPTSELTHTGGPRHPHNPPAGQSATSAGIAQSRHPTRNGIYARPFNKDSISSSQPTHIPSSLGSPSNGVFDQSQQPRYTNGTVEVPWQYYQYLQQLAGMSVTPEMIRNGLSSLPPTSATAESSSATVLLSQQIPNEIPRSQQPQSGPTGAQSDVYEEIPGYKMYSDIPALPAPRATALSHEPSENSTDFLLHTHNHRKKENLLYDNNNTTESDSSPSSSTSSSPKYSGRGKHSCGRWACVGFLLLTVISCTALAITLLSASGMISFQTSTPAPPVVKISTGAQADAQESRYNVTLNVIRNQTERQRGTIRQLKLQIENLSEKQTVQQSDLTALADRLPTGAINPKLCTYNSSAVTITDNRNRNPSTFWVPVYILSTPSTMDKIAIVATCGVDNYRTQTIESRKFQNTDLLQYRCRCSEFIDNAEPLRASCSVSYWLCPVIGEEIS